MEQAAVTYNATPRVDDKMGLRGTLVSNGSPDGRLSGVIRHYLFPVTPILGPFCGA